jgi:hypothetical protein
VGVVSTLATTYADSLAAGRVVAAPVSTLLADGMAVRVADALPRARVALVAASTAHADTTSAGAAGLWEGREKERGGGGGGNAGR